MDISVDVQHAVFAKSILARSDPENTMAGAEPTLLVVLHLGGRRAGVHKRRFNSVSGFTKDDEPAPLGSPIA